MIKKQQAEYRKERYSIDKELIPLLDEINNSSFLATTLSCAGHIELAENRERVPYQKSWTDDRLEHATEVLSESPLFSDFGCQTPFLQFICDDAIFLGVLNAAMIPYKMHLKQEFGIDVPLDLVGNTSQQNMIYGLPEYYISPTTCDEGLSEFDRCIIDSDCKSYEPGELYIERVKASWRMFWQIIHDCFITHERRYQPIKKLPTQFLVSKYWKRQGQLYYQRINTWNSKHENKPAFVDLWPYPESKINMDPVISVCHTAGLIWGDDCASFVLDYEFNEAFELLQDKYTKQGMTKTQDELNQELIQKNSMYRVLFMFRHHKMQNK